MGDLYYKKTRKQSTDGSRAFSMYIKKPPVDSTCNETTDVTVHLCECHGRIFSVGDAGDLQELSNIRDTVVYISTPSTKTIIIIDDATGLANVISGP